MPYTQLLALHLFTLICSEEVNTQLGKLMHESVSICKSTKACGALIFSLVLLVPALGNGAQESQLSVVLTALITKHSGSKSSRNGTLKALLSFCLLTTFCCTNNSKCWCFWHRQWMPSGPVCVCKQIKFDRSLKAVWALACPVPNTDEYCCSITKWRVFQSQLEQLLLACFTSFLKCLPPQSF